MKLIRLIVEAYLKGGGGGDWRFCLLASSILVDIAKNNVTKGDFIDLVVRSAISCFLGTWPFLPCLSPIGKWPRYNCQETYLMRLIFFVF